MKFSNGNCIPSSNGSQGATSGEWKSVVLHPEIKSQVAHFSATSSLAHWPAGTAGAIVRREPASLEDTIREEITGVVVIAEEPIDMAREVTLYKRPSNSAAEALTAESIAAAVSIYLQQAQAYAEEKQWKKAFLACQEALKIAPSTAEAYKLLGKILQQQGKVTDSMGFYAKALTLRPDFPEVYSNLGSLYAKKEQWEAAIDYYQKAIKQDPKFAVAYLNLAKVWQRLGQSEREMHCLATALRLKPALGKAKDHYRVAQFFESTSDRESAIVFYRQTVKQAPDLVAAHQRLADLLEDSGDWQGAAACYRQVLALNAAAETTVDENAAAEAPPMTQQAPPESTSQTKASQTEASQTEASQTEASQIEANQTEAGSRLSATAAATDDVSSKVSSLAERAQRHAQDKDWPEAIACLREAIQQSPQSATLYRHLAHLFEQNAQPQQAAESWYRAFILDPSWPNEQQCFSLGHRLAQQDNADAAARCYRQAIRIQPEFSEAYQALAQVLNAQGKTAEAEAVLQQFMVAAPVKK